MYNHVNNFCRNPSLGLATKARACEGAGQVGRPGVTFHALENVGECEGMNLHTPKWAPTLGVGVRWTLKFSKSDCRGQNPLDWRVLYIIENLLERRCLKWACMTHLDTSNTSYGQKKGRELNWQIDSQALKVKNRPDFLASKWCATYHLKALDKGYNFGNFRTPLGVPGQNDIWVLVLWPST
jgi:hypothetical protein